MTTNWTPPINDFPIGQVPPTPPDTDSFYGLLYRAFYAFREEFPDLVKEDAWNHFECNFRVGKNGAAIVNIVMKEDK